MKYSLPVKVWIELVVSPGDGKEKNILIFFSYKKHRFEHRNHDHMTIL